MFAAHGINFHHCTQTLSDVYRPVIVAMVVIIHAPTPTPTRSLLPPACFFRRDRVGGTIDRENSLRLKEAELKELRASVDKVSLFVFFLTLLHSSQSCTSSEWGVRMLSLSGL